MVKVYSDNNIENDIKNVLEETFDTCMSNREEIYWLITILRAFMRIPNKDITLTSDNIHLNKWQYDIVPIIEKFMKKWKL